MRSSTTKMLGAHTFVPFRLNAAVSAVEDIPLVHEIAAINSPPKAVVLGNHDAW